MAKHPKWFDKTPHHIAHPITTLKEAAKVIEVSAQQYRRDGNTDGAHASRYIARALREVASGKTWTEAFELSAALNEGKETK
jgi:hypothetical protein